MTELARSAWRGGMSETDRSGSGVVHEVACGSRGICPVEMGTDSWRLFLISVLALVLVLVLVLVLLSVSSRAGAGVSIIFSDAFMSSFAASSAYVSGSLCKENVDPVRSVSSAGDGCGISVMVTFISAKSAIMGSASGPGSSGSEGPSIAVFWGRGVPVGGAAASGLGVGVST